MKQVLFGHTTAALSGIGYHGLNLQTDTSGTYHPSKFRVKALANRADGSLRLFETDRGLEFESELRIESPKGLTSRTRWRVYELVNQGWIKHVCPAMAVHPLPGTYPPGTHVEVLQVPEIGDLALCLFNHPHCWHTRVQVGPSEALASGRMLTATRMIWEPADHLIMRPASHEAVRASVPVQRATRRKPARRVGSVPSAADATDPESWAS